jgi:hypothetical protein
MKSYDIKLLMYLILVSFVLGDYIHDVTKSIHVVTYTNYGYLKPLKTVCNF